MKQNRIIKTIIFWMLCESAMIACITFAIASLYYSPISVLMLVCGAFGAAIVCPAGLYEELQTLR